MPSHAPSVLHGIALVMVIAHCISNFIITDLEGHHPGRTIGVQSIVIGHSDVVLDQLTNSFTLIVDFRYLFHLLIKDECMLISEDHETGSIRSGRDKEGVSEYLTEVSLTTERILLRFVPWVFLACTCEDKGFRRSLVAPVCEE